MSEILLKMASSKRWFDTPANIRYLEEAINEAMKDGYRIHGSPFVMVGSFGEETINQMMIKEVADE